MAAYSALTGFLESEAPLFFGKIAGILAPQNPKIAEEQFKRVVEVADVPDFKPGQKVDVGRLMEIRESPECRDFRRWLSTVQDISDAEILNLTRGMKEKVASLADSFGGKAVRLAATSMMGFVPGAGVLLGPAAGAVDSFLIDRLLPRSGIVAFLTEMYPSLFIAACFICTQAWRIRPGTPDTGFPSVSDNDNIPESAAAIKSLPHALSRFDCKKNWLLSAVRTHTRSACPPRQL